MSGSVMSSSSAVAEQKRAVAKVLIIDDDRSVVLLLKKLIERRGDQAVAAVTGKEAVQLIDKESWDLVLVDLHLPGSDGMELAAAARARDPSVGTIVMTAYAEPPSRSVELDGFLEKPFKSLKEVEDAIAAALAARQRRALRSEPDPTVAVLPRPSSG